MSSSSSFSSVAFSFSSSAFSSETDSSFFLHGKKSANELIALDPVSTSRCIDNKFRVILDFI